MVKLSPAQVRALERIAGPYTTTRHWWLTASRNSTRTYCSLMRHGYIRERIAGDPAWKDLVITDAGRTILESNK